MDIKYSLKRVWFIGHMILLCGVLLSVLVGFDGTNTYSKYAHPDTAPPQSQTNNTIDFLNSKRAFIPKCNVLPFPTFRIHVTKHKSNESGMWNYSLKVTMNRFNHFFSSSFLSVAARILLMLSIAGIFRSTESTNESVEFPVLGNSWKFWFQFRSILTQATHCYPSSIRNYFSDIDKNDSVTKQKFMNYEWIRLSSFKEFPASSKVSSIRLAQSGFYYSGNGEEAICFCCGLRNDSWNTTETVNEIHRRLSPHCNFVKGEQSNNVAIHADSKPQTPGESITNESSLPTQGASGGPEDIYSENNMQYRIESTELQQSTQPLPASEDAVGVSDNVLTSGARQEASNRIGQMVGKPRDMHTNETHGSVTRFPGIVNEHPKHPEYAIKSVRLNSYTGWPSTNTVQPGELSTAGFFYAGINDCVRCFFCGGGIKNWDYGDNPWIEHARWFPNCAYVKQSKGQAFVEMCQTENADISPTNGAQGLISQQETAVEDSFIEDLNSMAAVLVLDKGYTQREVEDAIKQARLKHGKIELKVQHLLEFLVDNNYTASTSSPSASRPAESIKIQSAQNRQHKPVPELNTTEPSNEQRALYEENKQLKEQMMCKICMDKDANIVFLPCGHMVACVECAHALRKCAICRKIIQGTVRTYQS